MGLGLTAPVQAADISFGAVISGEVLPGVYGRVQVGNIPPPVVYVRPVIIASQPRRTPLTPIYLHVPPGHARNWSKHCSHYHACSQPVYFVKSAEYEPGYRPGNQGNGNGNKRKPN
jgi:hypothetical protein